MMWIDAIYFVPNKCFKFVLNVSYTTLSPTMPTSIPGINSLWCPRILRCYGNQTSPPPPPPILTDSIAALILRDVEVDLIKSKVMTYFMTVKVEVES